MIEKLKADFDEIIALVNKAPAPLQELAYEDQQSKLLYSSVEEIALREEISERDAALRLAECLADVPAVTAKLREWPGQLAPPVG